MRVLKEPILLGKYTTATSMKMLTVPYNCILKFDINAPNGGSASTCLSGAFDNAKSAGGGKGGRIVGFLKCKKDEKIYIGVPSAGGGASAPIYYNSRTTVNSFNGAGSGSTAFDGDWNSDSARWAAGGRGGYCSVSYTNTQITSDSVASSNTIACAYGGGGASASGSYWGGWTAASGGTNRGGVNNKLISFNNTGVVITTGGTTNGNGVVSVYVVAK